MTIKNLQDDRLLLFECISGSHAYGLAHAQSDVDKRGVFVLPKTNFYGLHYIDQVSDERNDEVYYEVKKFIQLLAKNNPNFLEVLHSPSDCILYRHPLFDLIKAEDFISKLCENTFAGYALSQIKKARGLNKKILNPIAKERQTILNFCFVNHGQGSQPLLRFLEAQNLRQEDCGLVNMPNMKDLYALFHQPEQGYSGIQNSPQADEVALSSIPKGELPIAYLYFNRSGYSTYCKDYRQYWEWVERRNEHRYQNTLQHGKNYDAKNMMHTFRLLHLAKEIAQTGSFQLKRSTDKDFLWQIRSGEFEYDYLVQLAQDKIQDIRECFANSDLPDAPDQEKVNALLCNIREAFYL